MEESLRENQGLDWPEDYQDILPRILREWGVGDQLYLNRSLSAGRSGALVYEVDVSSKSFTGQAILKLDEVSGSTDQAELETAQHAAAILDSPEFAAKHLPRIIHSLQSDDKLALLSTIAGRGLQYAVPWKECSFDRQLDAVKRVSRSLLEDWNADYHLSDGLLMPQDLLRSWLDYRIDPDRGGRIHAFMNEACDVPSDTPSFQFDGQWFPNPLAFLDGAVETPQRLQIRGALGHVHGDFHGLNLLIEQSDWQAEEAEGTDLNFFLIDLAMYQSQQFLFYDHAYFEFVMLLSTRGGSTVEDWEAVISQLRKYRPDNEAGLKTDDLGLRELVRALRRGVTDWININEADRLSYMESQALLARVAVGLSYTHKLIGRRMRQMALLYAATNLKDYLKLNRVDWPKGGPDFRFCDGEMASDETPSMSQVAEPVPQQSAPSPSVTQPADDTKRPAPASGLSPGIMSAASVVIAMIALLATSFFFWDLSRRNAETSSTDNTPAVSQPITVSDVPSIAVLPFTSLGTNINEGFADGLTIELINVLAATEAFRIPGFTSVFQYKGNPTDLRAIGRSLDVEYIVEGSVRQVGDEFRIEANVVRSDDGFLIWTDTFRENSEDIFLVEEELAKAIGTALAVPLEFNFDETGSEGSSNGQAYEAYLSGLASLEIRGPSIADAVNDLEKAVSLDPDYAAAWAALSIAYRLAPIYLSELNGEPIAEEVYYVKAKTAVLNALDLNPNLSIVQQAAGDVYQRELQWTQAERAYKAALAAQSTNHRVMATYAALLFSVGRPEEALQMLDQAITLDPQNEPYTLAADWIAYQLTGSLADETDIETIFLTSEAMRSHAFRIILSELAQADDLASAREILESCTECSQEFIAHASAFLDAGENDPVEEVLEVYKDDLLLSYEYVYAIGGADAALQAFDYIALLSYVRAFLFTVPWSLVDRIGDMDRFKELAIEIGLVNYWRTHGWPENCVTDGEDFSCS